MNAKESIEYCAGRITHRQGFLEAYKGVVPPTQFDEEIKAYDEIIRELSAAIPRKTSECKPTEADGEYVIAYSVESELWGCHFLKAVELNPNRYPFWLPMPAAPEVT